MIPNQNTDIPDIHQINGTFAERDLGVAVDKSEVE